MERATQIALAHWANLYSQNEFLPNDLEYKKESSAARKTGSPKEIVITLKYNDKIIQMLPPIDPDVLSHYVQSVLSGGAEQRQEGVTEEKEAIKLVVNTLDSIHIINIADIIYCESDKGYTTFHLINKEKVIASKILSKYEEVLPTSKFMRTHQSFLVNLEHIVRYEKKDKNRLITTDDYEVPVSHRLKFKLTDYFDVLSKG